MSGPGHLASTVYLLDMLSWSSCSCRLDSKRYFLFITGTFLLLGPFYHQLTEDMVRRYNTAFFSPPVIHPWTNIRPSLHLSTHYPYSSKPSASTYSYGYMLRTLRFKPLPTVKMTSNGSLGGEINEILPGLVESVMMAAREAGNVIIKMKGEPVEKTKANAKDLVTKADVECQRVIEQIMNIRHPDHFLLGEENVPPGPQASAAALRSAMDQHEFIWVVDPIDGTTNFVMDMPLSAVSIAVAYQGQVIVGVIYDPRADELFHAVRGVGAFLNKNPIRVSSVETHLEDAVIGVGYSPVEACMAQGFRGMQAMMPKVRTIRMIGSAALMMAWVACGHLTAYWEPDLNSWDTAAGYLIIEQARGMVTDLEGNPYSLSTRPLLCSNGLVHQQILDILLQEGIKGLDL